MEEQSRIEPSDTFAGFPAQVGEDVDGLMWLGYLEDEIEFCGHQFVIRTLRGEEELLAGLVSKEYTEVIGADKAYTWATISLALTAVDGDEDFCPPLSHDKKASARARFQYCSSKWFWPLAMRLFRAYADLLERQNAAIEAVENLFAGSPPTSTPFADSSTDRATSDQSEEDIREYLDDD